MRAHDNNERHFPNLPIKYQSIQLLLEIIEKMPDKEYEKKAQKETFVIT